MNHRKSLLPLLLISAFLVAGCQTLYTGAVSLTSVEASAMETYSDLRADKKTTPEMDAKVIKAHDEFRLACGVAKRTLIAYKAGNATEAEYLKVFAAAKIAVDGIFDLIIPLLTVNEGDTLKGQLQKASKP